MDGVDVAEELFALFGGDDDEKVVDVAAVMLVTKIEGDEAVELVEENIGKELAGQVADDDTTAFGLVEETFRNGEVAPVGARTANDNVFHGIVVDDLFPEELDGLVELVAVASVAADAVFMIVFFVVEWDVRSSVGVVFELAVETPTNTFVKFAVVETHEVALNIELDDESGAGAIFGGAADVSGEALLAEEGAFADAARIGVDNEAAVPPAGTNVIKEMVNDAIAEGGGDDFADDGVANDEGDTAAGFVAALDNTIAKID